MASYAATEGDLTPILGPPEAQASLVLTQSPGAYTQVLVCATPACGDRRFINQVLDPFGGGVLVEWTTWTYPDTTGYYYPDPYGSGFAACSGYNVAGISTED